MSWMFAFIVWLAAEAVWLFLVFALLRAIFLWTLDQIDDHWYAFPLYMGLILPTAFAGIGGVLLIGFGSLCIGTGRLLG